MPEPASFAVVPVAGGVVVGSFEPEDYLPAFAFEEASFPFSSAPAAPEKIQVVHWASYAYLAADFVDAAAASFSGEPSFAAEESLNSVRSSSAGYAVETFVADHLDEPWPCYLNVLDQELGYPRREAYPIPLDLV